MLCAFKDQDDAPYKYKRVTFSVFVHTTEEESWIVVNMSGSTYSYSGWQSSATVPASPILRYEFLIGLHSVASFCLTQ